MKRYVKNLLYAFYLIAALTAINYLFYLNYLNKIKNGHFSIYTKKEFLFPKNISALTISRIGYFAADKNSHFVNFSKEKNTGIMRIGCFGDSFTGGDEVGVKFDYPGLLQKIFIENGFHNIEVINFGSAWYSFAQTYILWKEVGSNFQLDFLMIGPSCLNFYERNLTFNHAWSDSHQTYELLHARYIIENNKLKLIDVVGSSQDSRIKNYFSFFPFLRYLRFDINSPAFLASLLPSGRTLHINPFYYKRGGINKEIEQLYSLFLSDMAASHSKVLVGQYDGDCVAMAKQLHKPNLNAFRLGRPRHFPYLTPRGHNSPCGNLLVAQQMFNALTKKEKNLLEILTTFDIGEPSPGLLEIKKLPLREYDGLAIEIAGVELGGFFHGYDDYRAPTKEFYIKQGGAAAFLAVKSNDASILDGVFVPLDVTLDGHMNLELSMVLKGKYVRAPLAPVRLIQQNVNLGVASLSGMEYGNNEIKIRLDDVLWSKLRKGARGVSIIFNNRRIMAASHIDWEKKIVSFKPIGYSFIIVSSRPDAIVDIPKIADSGIVYFVLYHKDGGKIKLPCAQWVKRKTIMRYE
jgi:hypothetical protein